MKYHEMKFGVMELKLRIRMRDHAELDKLSGGDFFATLTDEKIFVSKAFKVLGDCMFVGMRSFEKENGKFSRAQVDDMIDGMIDEGYDIDQAVNDVMCIAAVSGFFPKEVAEAILSGKIIEEAKAAEANA
jgi:hypothetical protein